MPKVVSRRPVMSDEHSLERFFARGNSYWLTRFVILRLLGFVYAIAFLIAAQQLVPLIGEHGLTPASHFLTSIQGQLGSPSAGMLRVPTIVHCRSSLGQALVCRSLFSPVMPTRSFSRFSGRCICRSFTSAKFGTAMAGKFSSLRPGSCRSFSVHCWMVARSQNAVHHCS